jgi:hypothetical protein
MVTLQRSVEIELELDTARLILVSFPPLRPVFMVTLAGGLLGKLAGRMMQIRIEHECQAADNQAVGKDYDFDGHIAG